MSDSPSVSSPAPKGEGALGGFLFAYGLALFNVGWASLARWQLEPIANIGGHLPDVIFFLAIMLTAWFAGVGPSVFATLLSLVVANWVLAAPEHKFTPAHLGDWVFAGTFLGVSVAFLALAQAARHAKTRAEANARMARVRQAELERLLAERHQAQEAQRQGEERFRFLAESIPHLVWSARPDGSLDYYNQRCFDYSGKNLEELRGWSWLASLHPDDVERAIAVWRQAVTTGTEYRIEYRLHRAADGQYRWHMGHALPLRDAQGRVVRWFGTCTDIHDLKLAQEQIQALNVDLEGKVQERTAKLRELVGELEHFSYTITHDMRAPLRAMTGFANLMLQEGCADCANCIARDYLGRIVTAAGRMDALITDALQYNRVVRAELPLEPVDVVPLLRGMMTSYPNLQPPHADIALEGDFPPVLGNSAALTQCFSNLLGNAVKFVAPGTRPRVRIWAETPDGRVRLWFEDNGIGIPHECQAHIFDMFYRGHVHYEGTGIGLAIVRKAAERMGGKVGVQSELGQGSRFWLELKKAEPGQAVASPIANSQSGNDCPPTCTLDLQNQGKDPIPTLVKE